MRVFRHPAILLLILINVLWAGAFPMARVALEGGFPPVTLAWFRWSLALLLLPLFLRRKESGPRMPLRDRLAMLLVGAVTLGAVHLLQYTGLSFAAPVVDAVLITSSESAMIIAMAALFHREPISRLGWTGVGCAMLGNYFLINKGWLPHWNASGTALGTLLVFLSALVECTGSVLARNFTRRYTGIGVMLLQALGASVVLAVPAWWAWHNAGSPIPTAPAWACAITLGAVNSAFCYGVWYVLMERMPLNRMSMFLYIQPVVGSLLGIWLLNERLSLFSLLGAAFVLIGIFLAVAKSVSPGVQESTL